MRRAPCDRDDSILDALEKNGFTIDAECLQGICGKDKVRILDGADALTQMGKTEKDTLKKVCKVEPGKYRLACMAKVRGLVKIETT